MKHILEEVSRITFVFLVAKVSQNHMDLPDVRILSIKGIFFLNLSQHASTFLKPQTFLEPQTFKP